MRTARRSGSAGCPLSLCRSDGGTSPCCARDGLRPVTARASRSLRLGAAASLLCGLNRLLGAALLFSSHQFTAIASQAGRNRKATPFGEPIQVHGLQTSTSWSARTAPEPERPPLPSGEVNAHDQKALLKVRNERVPYVWGPSLGSSDVSKPKPTDGNSFPSQKLPSCDFNKRFSRPLGHAFLDPHPVFPEEPNPGDTPPGAP